MKKLIILIAGITAITHGILAQEFGSIEKKIDSLIKAGTFPSIAVGVLKDGDIIYEKAFGHSNREKDIRSTVHTPYQLASLSKPITATAIMKLHEEGKLRIDDPITKWVELKKVDSSFPDPTIQQVMNHTSGLGTYFDIYYADENIPFTDFETAWEQYGIQFQRPGLVCEYSNLGYGLLDYIISEVTGESFAAYLDSSLFSPLNMNDSHLVKKEERNELARKYGPENKVLPPIQNNTPGAGNVAASVHDMLLFASLHFQNGFKNFLSAESILQMQDYQEPNALFHYYQDTYYGLGWYGMVDDGGQKVIWHEGGMMGASTMLKLYPKENLAIVLLTNTYNSNAIRTIADEMTTLLIPDYQPTPINEVAEYAGVESDSTFIGTWSGTMQIEDQEIPISLDIKAEGIDIFYIDNGFNSFLTDYQPLPYRTKLLFGAVNQNYFIGTGTGELPTPDKRRLPHLLSFKLFKDQDLLKGTIVNMAAAEREYYARPYFIELSR